MAGNNHTSFLDGYRNYMYTTIGLVVDSYRSISASPELLDHFKSEMMMILDRAYAGLDKTTTMTLYESEADLVQRIIGSFPPEHPERSAFEAFASRIPNHLERICGGYSVV